MLIAGFIKASFLLAFFVYFERIYMGLVNLLILTNETRSILFDLKEIIGFVVVVIFLITHIYKFKLAKKQFDDVSKKDENGK